MIRRSLHFGFKATDKDLIGGLEKFDKVNDVRKGKKDGKQKEGKESKDGKAKSTQL